MTSSPTPRKRSAALAFIFVTVLIDVLSFGLIIPVLPVLVGEFVGAREQQSLWYRSARTPAGHAWRG